MPKAHALPSTLDERRAKIRKASLARQKESRDSSCSLSFFLRFHCLGTHPSRRQRLYVLTKNYGSCTVGSLCQHDCPLTTENKTEHETDPERGKDRLARVLADVLLAVVLKTADTMERIIPDLFRATQIFIGHCACGRAEILGRFARVRPATLCFLSRLR
jgi:hypothetical protein